MKQPLHRKKLQLALQALGDSAEDDLRGKLDHNWVTSEYDTTQHNAHTLNRGQRLHCCVAGWLDDIGLPQYKSQFDEARVDGRVLHFLTVVSPQEEEGTGLVGKGRGKCVRT